MKKNVKGSKINLIPVIINACFIDESNLIFCTMKIPRAVSATGEAEFANIFTDVSMKLGIVTFVFAKNRPRTIEINNGFLINFLISSIPFLLSTPI